MLAMGRMGKKNTNDKIDYILYAYYENLQHLSRYNQSKEQLLRSNREIEERFATTNISLEAKVGGITYSDGGRGSRNINSTFEKDLEYIMTKLETQYEKNKISILTYDYKIHSLIELIYPIELFINDLDETKKIIIEMYYCKLYSQDKIAMELYTSRPSVRRHLNNIKNALKQAIDIDNIDLYFYV